MGRVAEWKGADHPLLSFRIFPSIKSRLFLYVKLFKNNAAMYRYAKQTSWLSRSRENYDALCRTYVRQTRGGKVQPEMGEILLTQSNLWPDAVAHECTHGMFEFMRRKKLQMPDRLRDFDKHKTSCPDEEIVCHAVGDMTNQIYRKLVKHGIEF